MQRRWPPGSGARSHLTEQQYAEALRAGQFTKADLLAAAEDFSLPADQIVDYLLHRADWEPTGSASSWPSSCWQVPLMLTSRRTAAPAACSRARWASSAVRTTMSPVGQRVDLPGEPGLPRREVCGGVRGVGPGQRSPWLRDAPAQLPICPTPCARCVLMAGSSARGAGGVPCRCWDGTLDGGTPDPKPHDWGPAAIRVTFDVFVAAARGHRLGGWPWRTQIGPAGRSCRLRRRPGVAPAIRPPDALRLAAELSRGRRVGLWQRAWEQRYRNRLVDPGVGACGRARLRPVARGVQAIFCIDVRPERFRRHLEAAGDVQTFGFAGFFRAARAA